MSDQKLPIPGVDCPAWATHIAWDAYEGNGDATVYASQPSPHGPGSFVNTHRKITAKRLPAYDNPSLAGGCVELPRPCKRFDCRHVTLPGCAERNCLCICGEPWSHHTAAAQAAADAPRETCGSRDPFGDPAKLCGLPMGHAGDHSEAASDPTPLERIARGAIADMGDVTDSPEHVAPVLAALERVAQPVPREKQPLLWRAWNCDGMCFESHDEPTLDRVVEWPSLDGCLTCDERKAASRVVYRPDLDGQHRDRIERIEQPAASEPDSNILQRMGTDGGKWAAEFRTTALRLGYSDMDEGWLIGWFCNAIVAGMDRAAQQPAASEPAALYSPSSTRHPSVESNHNRGLFGKFFVSRVDGSDGIGRKHDGCDYFVLDLTHDRYAGPALAADENVRLRLAAEAELQDARAEMRRLQLVGPHELRGELLEARALAWEQAGRTAVESRRAWNWEDCFGKAQDRVEFWRQQSELRELALKQREAELQAERTAHAATKAALGEAQKELDVQVQRLCTEARHHTEALNKLEDCRVALGKAHARLTAGEWQEPVAWLMHATGSTSRLTFLPDTYARDWDRTPLYASPPSTVTEAECQRRVAEAVREEREACAKVANDHISGPWAATRIRARGE